MIELTKVQLQASLNKLLEQENGLTSVLEMTLNGLMYSERTNYLEQSSSNRSSFVYQETDWVFSSPWF